MSSSTSTFNPEPIRNLNLIHCRWGKYYNNTEGAYIPITFHCTSKNLPAYKDAASWNVSSDNPLEYTGRTVTGKSEGIETIELTIETDPTIVYQRLLTCFGKWYQSDLEMTYLPRKYYTSKYFQDAADGGFGGELTNVFPDTMYPPYYEVEKYDTVEYTIVVPRCVMIGLAPSGGDNNSASTTTVKFQAEGGPIENQAFLVQTHYFSAREADYGMPTVLWDGITKNRAGDSIANASSAGTDLTKKAYGDVPTWTYGGSTSSSSSVEGGGGNGG